MSRSAEIHELLSRADPPLDRAVALLAAHAEPALDVEAVLGELDALAANAPATSTTDLFGSLFGPGGFAGNRVDYYDPENSMLPAVLRRRTGIPISLAVVGIEVGRRVGLPLNGIGMPGHFLVSEASTGLYFDPFNGPHPLDTSGCESLFRMIHGPGARFGPELLVPTPVVAIVERMLANLTLAYQGRGDRQNLAWVLRLRAGRPGAGADAHRVHADVEASVGRFDRAAAAMRRASALSADANDQRRAEALEARLN